MAAIGVFSEAGEAFAALASDGKMITYNTVSVAL